MVGLGATARRLLEHARQLLQPGGRGLEQVVELAQLLHRLEEAPQVEQERGEHADAHVAVEHAPAAVEQHDRGRDAADELHARAVRRGEPLRPQVGARGSGRRGARRSPGCAAHDGTRARPGCRRGSRRSGRSRARWHRASRGTRVPTGCGTNASAANSTGNAARTGSASRRSSTSSTTPMPTIEQHRRDEGDDAVCRAGRRSPRRRRSGARSPVPTCSARGTTGSAAGSARRAAGGCRARRPGRRGRA